MKNFLNKSFCLLLLIILAACENASDTVVNIPNVQVGCTSDNDEDCSTANPNPNVTAFVRMSRSGCDNIGFEPIATGSVNMECDANGCEGTVTSWTDPGVEATGPVTEILTGRMDVCSQVDIDDNGGLPSTGDLINDDSININSSATITVDTWRAE